MILEFVKVKRAAFKAALAVLGVGHFLIFSFEDEQAQSIHAPDMLSRREHFEFFVSREKIEAKKILTNAAGVSKLSLMPLIFSII